MKIENSVFTICIILLDEMLIELMIFEFYARICQKSFLICTCSVHVQTFQTVFMQGFC